MAFQHHASECRSPRSSLFRNAGGIFIYTNASLTSGVYLTAGDSSWNSYSDRGAKENLAPVDAQAQDKKPNILVIWGDDIGRDNISAYNLGIMGYETPNIDALAKRGVVFNRAYCQVAVCNPSRATVSSGLRPQTLGVFNNSIDWRRRILEGMRTLPEFFRGDAAVDVVAQGLEGLEAGQRIMVIFHLHRSQGFDLLQHPRGDRSRPRRGRGTRRGACPERASRRGR